MTDQASFFALSDSKQVFTRFLRRMPDLQEGGDEFGASRNGHIHLIVKSMMTSPDQWDRSCQINIRWIGSGFIGQLSEDSTELSKGRLDDIFAICFRFLLELYLSMPQDLSAEFERARQFGIKNLSEFDLHAREQIEFAMRSMPVEIFKEIANSDQILDVKNLGETAQKAREAISKFDEDLTLREGRVIALKEKLEEYENAFNFVGLYKGFDGLAKERSGEIHWLKV